MKLAVSEQASNTSKQGDWNSLLADQKERNFPMQIMLGENASEP